MQLIEYKPGTELHNYQNDLIVKNVPVEYFDTDRDAIDYYEKHKNDKAWKARNKGILDNFNPVMFGEFFYCTKCQRMEDGAHRWAIAKEKGITHVDVRIGGDCYKNYIKAGRFLRGDSTFIETLSKLIDENPKRHKLDKKWLMASASDKWPFILRHVDFRGKSFLDIGCNVGYSVFRAWSLMADYITGIDIRADVKKVATSMKMKLGIKYPNFQLLNLNTDQFFKDELPCFNIVMSMGMVHYLAKKNYEHVFTQMMGMCEETLIIELRLRKGRKDITLTTGSGGQTLPTEGWLRNKLENNGFKKFHIYSRAKDRALWICKREVL